MDELFDVESTSRINTLVSLIKKYQDSYYNGEAEISDEEFDSLWDELKRLDPQNKILQKVGADSGNFKKIRHVMPMGSQEKAADPEQFLDWVKNHVYPEYLVEYKLDGASLELQFERGILKAAVTRGDGSVGDEITFNAKKMRGVPSALYQGDKIVDYTGGIRGEVVMTHEVFKEFYSDKANCRNAANGLMKRKDGKGSENLQFIAYDAFSTSGTQPFSDEEEKINWLKSLSFYTVPLFICNSAQQVIDYRAQVMEKREQIEYDIDGLVVKERLINHEDALRARPDRQIAFKFSLEEAVSTVRKIEWSESGATYTPVAIFDEVALNGTIVKRASLANPETLRKLGVKIGSRVVVVKRGEIIPKIESVLSEQEGQKTFNIEIPKKCECCGSTLVDEGTRLFCPNKNCDKKIIHQLLKWVSVIDIRDLGETLVNSLFNAKKVRCITDFYKLKVEDLIPFFLNEESILKEKNSLGAKKVYDSIQSKTKVPLSSFIAGFDIEGIGETTVQKLVESGYDTIEKLFSATEEDFSKVYGFAQIMAHTFVAGLRENEDEIKSLAAKYVTVIQNSTGALQGKSFCFTGELKTMKRSEAEELVKKNGGSIKSSVTKDLSYLVTNDTASGSSKNEKAKKIAVPVITEEEFLSLF
ncbi:NAD-dependent DNA ligase LigA [Treponema pectinovorum]|uniref:NAD-dependent DNA ligase LigA n=1 Tax=Treponema pectinovorum TaxID=164 RepID=UPI0011CA9515|nr:NAD-dependent DNA ligase LigA [Treponema pectinovorum]